jgi:alkylhydroperoxidase family enzyme
VDANSAGGRMYGLSDEEIAALLRDDVEQFPRAEQTLIRMADALSGAPANVSDELYAELRRHFTEEQLIELAADAAQENYRARWNRVFDVGSDVLYCAIPQK